MRSLLLVAAAAAAIAVPATATNLVTNGNFASGFSGWSQFGNTGFTGVNSAGFAFFGPIGSTGGITQNLATTAGQAYLISFSLRNRGGPTNSFQADFGSQQLNSFSNAAAFGFTTFSFTKTATGSSTPLTFTIRHDPSFYDLTSVSVTGVPEPANWAMLIAGFGLVGALMRRRRAVAA